MGLQLCGVPKIGRNFGLNDAKLVRERDDFSRRYHRDRLSDWLLLALEQAGRQDEIIPLCEREAEKTGSYVRLVNYLISDNRREEAEHWIHEGITATQKQWPGIASRLRTMLREIREKENDWLSVAAFRAEDFFTQPSLKTFEELHKASEKAGVWPDVKKAAMRYLETGNLPGTAKTPTIPAWPLPGTGLAEVMDNRQERFPMTGTLIDIAIHEEKPDEVIRWYDHRKQESVGWGQTWFQENEIARAIADTYPDRAIAIWKRLAEGMIAQAKPKAYETAAEFLRHVHRVLRKLGREKEWQSYLVELRQTNARKRRLLEILDNLGDTPIIGEDKTTALSQGLWVSER
jgi:uncharacterized Zn finger protein